MVPKALFRYDAAARTPLRGALFRSPLGIMACAAAIRSNKRNVRMEQFVKKAVRRRPLGYFAPGIRPATSAACNC